MKPIRVMATTIGQQNTSQVTLTKPYVWRKKPGWFPGNPAYAEEVAPSPMRRVQKTVGRDARFAQFCQLRGQGVSVPEAGEQVGVGAKTARNYESERRKQLKTTEATQ